MAAAHAAEAAMAAAPAGLAQEEECATYSDKFDIPRGVATQRPPEWGQAPTPQGRRALSRGLVPHAGCDRILLLSVEIRYLLSYPNAGTAAEAGSEACEAWLEA